MHEEMTPGRTKMSSTGHIRDCDAVSPSFILYEDELDSLKTHYNYAQEDAFYLAAKPVP